MRYLSMSSGREKDYVIEPYRLVYRPGGLYSWRSSRSTGSCARSPSIASAALSLHEERFTPAEIAGGGVRAFDRRQRGTPPEHIEIAFEPRIAPYVRERRWHASQQARGPAGRRRRRCRSTSATTGRCAAGSSASARSPASSPRRRWRRRSRTKSIARSARYGVEYGDGRDRRIGARARRVTGSTDDLGLVTFADSAGAGRRTGAGDRQRLIQ